MTPRDFDPDRPECPECQGDMYDNREDKASERSPDFKCKDSQCNGRVWLQPPRGRRNGNGRGGRGGGSNGGSRGMDRNTPVRDGAPRMEVPALSPPERKAHRDKTLVNYFSLMKLVETQMAALAKEKGIAMTMDAVQGATTTLYTIMDRKKLLEPPPVTSAAPPATTNRQPASQLAGAGAGPYEDPQGSDDDELPF